jgi:uncharacterized protein YoxC
MLAEQDFSQMQEHILQVLPQLLRQNPEIATTIEGMLAHQFPRREEFIQFLNEMKLLREDTNRGFDLLHEEVNQLREDTNRRFEQIDRRFGLVEQRLEQIDRRFEQVDKRLEQFERHLDLLHEEVNLLREDTNRRFEEVNKHFEQVDRRFEQVDKRLDLLHEEVNLLREDSNRRFELLHEEVNLLREDTNQRFEEVNKRFEQIDRRFEQVEKRLDIVEQRLDLLHEEVNQLRDEMNKRFELLQTEMDRRFELLNEEMNKRFEQLQAEMDRRFEEEKLERLDMKRRLIKVEATVDRLDKKITQFDAWLKVVTGNIGDKRGQEAEQLFALGLSYGLKRADIKPETIQLRQMFRDDEGIVFPLKGKYIEVDILAENGQLSVFEVKITAIETDVVTFARKVQLIQSQNKQVKVSGIFISPDASEPVKQCCTEYGLVFVG